MHHSASRPKFLNLLQIRMPIGAVASIAHRAWGTLLFLTLPIAAFLLDLSLQGPSGFDQAAALLTTPLFRALKFLLAWSLLHHLLAGLRFLFIDLEIGIAKPAARLTALLATLGAPLLALLYMWGWG